MWRQNITAPDYSELRFDDLKQGDRFPLGEYPLSREEVIEFASRYDPQAYHLDDEAAAANPIFGRLSASGWHSSAILNLLMDRFWKATKIRGVAGGGIDSMRWLHPVYPGDVLTGDVEVVMVRNSASRPERGIMTMRAILRNQHGTEAVNLLITGFFAR